MNARDDILAGLRAAESASVGDETPEELLAAYRAEILAEDDADRTRLSEGLRRQIEHQRAAKARWRERAEKAEEQLRNQRAGVLAEAIEAARGEYLTDGAGTDEDNAYNNGITDAVAAIGALLEAGESRG